MYRSYQGVLANIQQTIPLVVINRVYRKAINLNRVSQRRDVCDNNRYMQYGKIRLPTICGIELTMAGGSLVY